MSTPRLDQDDLWKANLLWRSGKGTYEIAKKLGTPEAAVANSLSDARERKRSVVVRMEIAS